MPNSRHTSLIDSPSSNLATNRRRSSITEHSFHGIDTPGAKPGSVTHVSGTLCYLCLEPLTFRLFDQSRRSLKAGGFDRDDRGRLVVVADIARDSDRADHGLV